MQGHSTASTLPPLPKDGPTHETEVTVEAKGVDEWPLPSATTSPIEEVEEERVEEAQDKELATTDDVSEVPTRKRHRAAQVVPSSMSSPAKEEDLRDDGDSLSSHSAKAAPLDVSPLCSAPPPKSGGELLFGDPNFEDLDSEEAEEHRFAPELFVLKFSLVELFCLCCMSSVTRSAETVRPPTPLAERASTPDQPEASPVATEVVKTVAT